MYSEQVKSNLAIACRKIPAYVAALPVEPDGEKLAIRRAVCGGYEFYKSHGPINIVVVGDSVSHGCVGGGIPYSYDTVYHNRLRHMINDTWPDVPVNIINTAVGGVTAAYAAENFARDVLRHAPDLLIVCYGLNDVNGTEDAFAENLGSIFDSARAAGIDCVYLSPNMLNTYRAEGTESRYFDYAAKTAEMQQEGRMDRFVARAISLAREREIPVADGYAIWRQLAADGVDTTLLLANLINHPLVEMHALFAAVLFRAVFGQIYQEEKTILGGDGMTAAAVK